MDILRLLTLVIQKAGVRSAFIQAVVFMIFFVLTYILYSCRYWGKACTFSDTGSKEMWIQVLNLPQMPYLPLSNLITYLICLSPI